MIPAIQRERGVEEFIELVAAVDAILRQQAESDAAYFAANCGRVVEADEARTIEDAFRAAYRWQYIHSGAAHPRFSALLSGLITEPQIRRIHAALARLH